MKNLLGSAGLAAINTTFEHEPAPEIAPLNNVVTTSVHEQTAMRAHAELWEFSELVEAAAVAHFETVDPVMLDCFKFWAVSGFTMTLDIDAIHKLWADSQRAIGWKYAQDYSAAAMAHPLVVDYELLDSYTRRFYRYLTVVYNAYSSGLHTGTQSALSACDVLAVSLREALFEGRPAPLDFTSKAVKIAEQHADRVADSDSVPHVFKFPMVKNIGANVHGALTSVIKEEEQADGQ